MHIHVCRNNTKRNEFISFVKEGQTAKGSQATSLLQEAKHWDMRVDLKEKLVFPDVLKTTPRYCPLVYCSEEDDTPKTNGCLVR